jgi:CubicO group peptidase (beta-lactamase class C family)
MYRPVIVSIGLLLGLTRSVTAQAPSADLAAKIDSFLSPRIAADSFSGVVAVSRNGRLIYQRAAGQANRETGRPMSVNTKLQIASTTKLFTQIAIRQLEQAGKLSLSDTVGKFLPDYPNAVVRSRVTVEQLLRHRSGIGSFWNERFMATHAEVRTVRDYMALFQNDSLLFAPGTSESYSNGGYVVLGAIIERVSGESYHDYLKSHIFEPAGMTETMPYDRRVAVANAAVGYTMQPLGGPVTGDRRLAGQASRPGTEANGSGPRLRIVRPDGRELSAEEARLAMARRSAEGAVRHPNSSIQPGMSGPAGDHYSTVGDFLKLANALTSGRLLDAAHTAAALGVRYVSGEDFRANGGGPGVNAEFSIYPSGDVMVVLSNYDPPSATLVAQYIRSLLASNTATTSSQGEIDSLHGAMVNAFKKDPSSVARFYTDDAQIIGSQRAR